MTARQADIAVPFLRAEFPEAVVDAIRPVLASGYVGAGPCVAKFERAIQDYLQSSTVVCTSSCTAALDLVYEDLGIGAGDIVLSTPMTCAATNIPLLRRGARIVWLDVDPISGNVVPATLRSALEATPDAIAAVVIDWAGTPCDYDGLVQVARAYGLPLVLDAAQSFGSTYKQRRAPSIDNVCYSFGPTKILSSIEGGAIVTSDAAAQRFRCSRWYGIDRERRDPYAFWAYNIEQAGIRAVQNDVFAAIGMTMLHRLDGRLTRHRQLANMYRSLLAGVSGLMLDRPAAEVVPNYWMFHVLSEDRANLTRKLLAAGIHAAIPHHRNDELSCFAERYPRQELPGVTTFDASYICLPVGPWVTDEQAERICRIIRSGW